MTASTPMLHGTDLDECCSNVFALTDLCGLKWRKYVVFLSFQASPADDPVLRSFSSAISHDILCAWRRSPQIGSQSSSDSGSLSSAKELWVFWFGDDPNLQGIVSAELKETCHGCWEDGLPHEPRSLLFKALHNLLERCLLSKKFIRLGKWFVRPCEKKETQGSSDHLSFSFSFFIHGESSVCTAVEIQQQPRVHHLTLDDVAVAASRPEGLPVLLGPYGLSGFLTGQPSHVDEVISMKLIDEWKKFYPLDSSTEWGEPSSLGPDKGIPLAMLVVVGETQMWYPSLYIVAPCAGLDSSDGSVLASADSATCGPPSLTPPESPIDPNSKDVVTGGMQPPSAPRIPSPAVIDRKKLTQSLVQEVWQEVTVAKPVTSKNSSVSSLSKPLPTFIKSEYSNEATPSGQWDFEEPFKRTSCLCTSSSNISRPKPPTQVRPSFGITRPVPSPGYPLPSVQQPQQHQPTMQQQQNQGSMKAKKEKKKLLVPFHHRVMMDKDVPEAVKSHVGAMTKGLPTANVLTAVTQKRHLDVASAHQSVKKYPLLSQTAASLLQSSGGSGVKPEATKSQSTASFVSVNSSLVPSQNDVNDPARTTARTEQENQQSMFLSEKDTQKFEDDAESCYLLPQVGKFDLPILPPNPLDCRPLVATGLETVKDMLSPLPSEIALFGSTKRPSTDVDVECTSSPAKRSRWESVSLGKSRSDSTGSGRSKGRRNSSMQSPVSTPLSEPFTPQPEDLEMETVQPLMKSPTQGRVMSSKPRRRSSSNSVASPSVPSPLSADPAKPARVKNRRQSARRQQQGGKEKQSKEECKVRQEQFGKGMFCNMSSSDEEIVSKILPSPPTPRPSNLMTEQDLAVTVNDLDQLFDTDEEEDVLGQTKLLKSDFTLSQQYTFDPFTSLNSHHPIANTGVVAQQDLARMFPTPPSQEASAEHASGGSDYVSPGNDYVSPGSVKTVVHSAMMSPESQHVMSLSGTEMEHEKQYNPRELGPVFEIPNLREFPVSYSFEVVPGFPSCKPLPSELRYCPSSQHASQKSWTLSFSKAESADFFSSDVVMATPSPAVGYTYVHPSENGDLKHLTSVAMSPTSPASSVSSFSLPSQFAKPFHGNGFALKPSFLQVPLPEVNSLSKVLSLSDSHLNYFSDKCYDSVNLCSCSTSSDGTRLKGTVAKGKDFDKCVCGFGPLEGTKFTEGAGLFPDDVYMTSRLNDLQGSHLIGRELKKEEETTGLSCKKKVPTSTVSSYPLSLLEEIVNQCSSPFSCSNLKYQLMYKSHGIMKHVSSVWPQSKDSSILQSVPHTVAVCALNCIRQLLQEALQKSTSRKTWEQPNGTAVQGPLSWKQLHHLATKGTEDTPRVQRIPSVMVGYCGDWLSLSPIALQFWEKLLLEPYSCQRDVAYLVVAPENDLVLSTVKMFFKEFSAVYETCRLGQHVPIAKVLREGILRVGPKSLKFSKEPIDDWFTQQGCSTDGAKLKLYAQTIKYQLGPYLGTLSLDRHIFDRDKSDDKIASKFGTDSDKALSDSGHRPVGTSAATPTTEQPSSGFGDEESDNDSEEPPTLVVYLVNPFSSNPKEDSFPSFVGLLRCIAEIMPTLSETIRRNVIFQVVPIHQILQVDMLTCSRDAALTFVTQLKCLAFSVFSRCRKSLQVNLNTKSLTGFGPAARHEALLRQREAENAKVYSSPYVLCQPLTAPMETVPEESAESLVAVTRNASVLYCGYCLSCDDNYLLAVCTDSVGEMIESCVIPVDPPLRPDGRPRKTAARTKALMKLWEFCHGVIASSLVPWRLVVTKMGRIGPEELKDWKEILSKTSVMAGDQKFKDACKACYSMVWTNRPMVLGASLTSLEPEPSVRLYFVRALPKVSAQFDGSGHARTSPGSVPKPDLSRTYIAVMPVASLMCSSGKPSDTKFHAPPDTAPEAVVTDTDILLAAVDDDENDQDPLTQLFPLLNPTSPSLSPSCMLPSPLDSSQMQSSSPLTRPSKLAPSPVVSVPSPFQPIARVSPLQPLHSTPSPSLGNLSSHDAQEEEEQLSSNTPCAQGYIISTVHTGKMPASFWSTAPHLETSHPAILKASLHVHNPDLMEAAAGLVNSRHALATKLYCHVLRSILQTYDALSWLTVDPVSRDRRSCLPVHLYMLCQLYDTLSILRENQTSS